MISSDKSLWFLVKRILNFIPAYDPKVQDPAVQCLEERNHWNQTTVKSNRVENLRGTHLVFFFPLSFPVQKEATQENICYCLSQRDKAKFFTLCELDKDL